MPYRARPAPLRRRWAKISPCLRQAGALYPSVDNSSMGARYFEKVDTIVNFSYPIANIARGEEWMKMPDEFSQSYQPYLTGTYDCVDRIVLNAYFIFAQSAGGFRTWWRQLRGSDEDLDNTHLMRFAGRFSRRIHAYAKKQGIPLIHCKRMEDKHELAKGHLPNDSGFRGIFCIIAGVAPMPVFQVHRSPKGITNIKTKTSYVNQYSFHLMDPEWGHLIIKLCPHPPFNAQVILNGHEYVARQAQKSKVSFSKEGNCFTEISDATGLARIADTMRASSSVGRLVRACERWIYRCLCFALESEEQKKSGFIYSYSVYQSEYSRNLLFTRGRYLDQVFHSVIDRTRAPLNLKMVKTIFGSKHRPLFKWKRGRSTPRCEAVVERPVYDLTIFKIHFGKLTIKMYSKGERVLRIEVIVHNTKQLRCGKRIDRFPQIVALLKGILERFLKVLQGVEACFVDDMKLDTWPLASKVGQTRVGGLDVNRPRMRAVMEGVIGLSANPRGFTAADLAGRVKEILSKSVPDYQARQASYDLKKLRAKDLVRRIRNSRYYEATPEGLRAMAGFVVLREKVLIPLLAGAGNGKPGPKSTNRSQIDIHYENVQREMQKIFKIIGIAA